MSNQPARSRDPALVEKEAVAWFTRMSGTPTKAERRDFASWLDMSADHVRAYEEVRALWSDLDATARGIGDDELTLPLQRIADFRRARRRAGIGKAAIGCLAALAIGGWLWVGHPNLVQNLGADHVTARAERRVVTLPEGSTVLLDADSALDAEISEGERRIRLLRGSAFFTVQPSEVPFVVEAGGGEARVLGTQFDMSLNGEGEVTVTLSSGSLEVAAGEDGRHVLLSPGESVEYGATGMGPVRAVNLEESTAWHRGRLIFDDVRLADVLTQIGRYRDGRIVVLGSEVGARRVTGNIALDDTEAALEAMRSTVGFRMTSLVGKVVLIGP